VLIPVGWELECGSFLYNVDVWDTVGRLRCSVADLRISNDLFDRISIRFLPDFQLIDPDWLSPADKIQYPPGSVYKDRYVVYKHMSPNDFVYNMIFPYSRPMTSYVRTEVDDLLFGLANEFRDCELRLNPGATKYEYRCEGLFVKYFEADVEYLERIVVVVEDSREATGGYWSGRSGIMVRAPVSDYERLLPALAEIFLSVESDSAMILEELEDRIAKGFLDSMPQSAALELARLVKLDRDSFRMSMFKSLFITLDQLVDFYNPIDDRIISGTNRWEHRWLGRNGSVVLSDSSNFNPNTLTSPPELKNDSFMVAPRIIGRR